jgi:hypothetical protein
MEPALHRPHLDAGADAVERLSLFARDRVGQLVGDERDPLGRRMQQRAALAGG